MCFFDALPGLAELGPAVGAVPAAVEQCRAVIVLKSLLGAFDHALPRSGALHAPCRMWDSANSRTGAGAPASRRTHANEVPEVLVVLGERFEMEAMFLASEHGGWLPNLVEAHCRRQRGTATRRRRRTCVADCEWRRNLCAAVRSGCRRAPSAPRQRLRWRPPPGHACPLARHTDRRIPRNGAT